MWSLETRAVVERTDEAHAGSVVGEPPAAERSLEQQGSLLDPDARASRETLVIIGNGMMSFRLCQKLVECRANEVLNIVVFGEEPHPAYDRVHLTDLFSGKTPEDLTLAPPEWYAENGIELRLDDPVVEIDRDDCSVRSENSKPVLYDRLVFATGSRPFVPPIAGVDLPGVFVYRTIEHLVAIDEYAQNCHRAAVIGGGLLGLEAAKAVYDLGNLEVHIVEFAPGLMPRQLDAQGSEILKDKIEKLGVRVHVSKQTTRIEDAAARDFAYREDPWAFGRVLHFSDGTELVVDMVVISAGIRPRDDLAGAAGIELAKNGGILIDDHLTTSDPRIFAVGECAVHRGTTYGLAFPGYKMVDVLVDNLVGGTATFEGADQSAKLKLLGVVVASLGEYNEKAVRNSVVEKYCANGEYRKLVTRDGRIVGAISVGEWENLDRVRDAIEQPSLVSFGFWDMRRFRATGNLWRKSESPHITEWPEDALVCGCLRVSRGTLSRAKLDGCSTVEALCARTGAGTICGSCKPLLTDLLGAIHDSVPPSMRGDAAPPSMRSAPRSVRSGPISRRYSQPPLSSATPGPSSPGAVNVLGRRRSVIPPPSRPIQPARAPTSVAPPMAALEEPAPDSPGPSSDTGPMSMRGSQLPQPQSRRSFRPSAPPPPAPSQSDSSPPLRSELERQEVETLLRASASRPPSFRPPKQISITENERGESDEDAGPISVRGASLREASLSRRSPSVRPTSSSTRPLRTSSIPPSSARRMSVEYRSASDAPSGHAQLLPPKFDSRADSIPPPPISSSPPQSVRDLLPASVRDSVSLKQRDSGQMMREAARLARDNPAEGREASWGRESTRGREAPYGQGSSGPPSEVPSSGGRASRDQPPSSRSKRDSAPPSRRRDSLPPLRPISVPPVQGSVAPGRLSAAPGRVVASSRRSLPERGYRVLFGTSIVALLAVVVIGTLGTLGPLSGAQSSLGTHVSDLWMSSAGKRVTGYVAVGLALAGQLLSLRKSKASRFTWSDVPIFRILHAAFGVIGALALIFHTGFHLGRNLNNALMIDFLALTILGAIAGVVFALSHRFSPITAPKQRDLWSLAHLILFLPLPVLLALHVIGAYYY